MLAPDTRTVAVELLRPPAGYRLDTLVLTTYSLDLEALLALPLAVLAHADGGIEELLEDPLLLLEALREAGERVHVFVDEAGIAVPGKARALYAMLESSVHPVRAPNGGAFHPKVWVARFHRDDAPPLLRVAVLSRNLTFDRSWDIVVASEASPAGQRRVRASLALGELLRALPEMAAESLSEGVRAALASLAGETERTRFPGPEGFDSPLEFHVLGLEPTRKHWCPQTGGSRLLAVSPFVTKRTLEAVFGMASGEHTLISRQEELDKLSDEALEGWDDVRVLLDAAQDEPDDATSARPSGLHAKVIAVESGWDVTWYVGSANLTESGFIGRNVEVMAALTGRKGRPGGKSGSGIDRFTEAGFGALCAPYRRGQQREEDAEVVAAAERLEEARRRLVDGDLDVVCEGEGRSWSWTLRGSVDLPEGVRVTAWPVSLPPEQARALQLPVVWTLPVSHLTAFVAFELSVPVTGVDDVRLTLKLPAEGMPEGRMAQVLRSLIDSPERFLRFLRALLGGLEGLPDWNGHERSNGHATPWNTGLGGETLLEDLVRVASREPARLEPVRRLIHDLRQSDEGSRIVPDDLLAVWEVVDRALASGEPA